MRFSKPMTAKPNTTMTRAAATGRGNLKVVYTAALAVLVGVAFAALPAGCDKEAPRPAPSPPAEAVKAPPPAAPAPAGDAGAKSKMVANPDGLSLADRIAKRQAAEAKVAAELAAAEKDRLLAYDRQRLPLHKQTFAFLLKTRAQLDAVEKKGAGGKAELDKLRDAQQKPMAAAAKKMGTIDPKGGNSNVTTDYDVMFNALANDYPAAIAMSYEGDKAPLEEQRAELDKRAKKIEDWLGELGAAQGGNAGKAGKAGKPGKKKK